MINTIISLWYTYQYRKRAIQLFNRMTNKYTITLVLLHKDMEILEVRMQEKMSIVLSTPGVGTEYMHAYTRKYLKDCFNKFDGHRREFDTLLKIEQKRRKAINKD